MKKIVLLAFLMLLQFTNAQNNAFTFNGIDQQIATYTQQTNVRFTTQNFTIEAWVKPAAFVGGSDNFEHTIIGNDSSNTTGYVLRTGGSRKLDFTFGNGTTWYSVTSANPVFTVDEWTHVAIVRDGTTFTLYANGVQVAQQTFTQNISLPNSNLRIAESAGFNGRFFNGSLDEIKIWNSARIVAEVREDLAETATPLPSELIVYYKMNQTTGQAVVSETAVNLFAQYLPTAQVNSGAGFFRIYTYTNATNSFLWSTSGNWINDFIPNNLGQEVGDIININASGSYDSTENLVISNNVTLNILNNKFLRLDYFSNTGVNFINNGTVNNNGTIKLSNSTNKIINNGVFNISSLGVLLYYDLTLNSNSLFSNFGILKCNDINNDCGQTININPNAILNNLSNATIYATQLFILQGGILDNNGLFYLSTGSYIRGTINNNNYMECLVSFSITNGPSGIINNLGNGIIKLGREFNNDGVINNNKIISFENTSAVRKFTNTGTISNLSQNSEFKIVNATSKIVNQGVFNYESIITNNGIFQNDATGIIKEVGPYGQFDNNSGAAFTNTGTHISGRDFNNSGTHSQTGTHSGSGFFNGSLFTNPANAAIAPSTNSGTGIGTLNFASGLTNNGNINIEIGGTTAGSGYDKINITGTATLGGTLNTSIINGYIPPVGTTEFAIITATSVTGTFASVVLPVATQGVVWSIVYKPLAVILKSVVTALTNTNIITACDNYTWSLNNQTYTVSGNYFYPFPNSNITQKLALTIVPGSTFTTAQTACDSFFWSNNNTNYTQSGIYTGTTINCVTQKLNLTIIPAAENITTQAACNSYSWANNGQTYTQSGNYLGTTTNCITQKLNLTITPSSENLVYDTACATYIWANNGQTYTQSGTYTGTTTNCITQKLNLVIFPITNETIIQTKCGGFYWNFADEFYTQSGNYTVTNNCDTKTLNLTITPLIENFTTITACDSYTWASNGQAYTTSGIYDGGIDQCTIQKLNLTINPTTSSVLNETACGTYYWESNGTNYTQSGTYIYSNGCETRTLNLTITPSTLNTTTATACDSYTWNNQTYNQSGNYTGNTTNCITEKLNLTITPSSVNTTTATACDSYTWNNQTYNQSGNYTGNTTNCITEKLNLTITGTSGTTFFVNGCDSYTWTINGQTYTQSGFYPYLHTLGNGCTDYYLNLTMNTTPIITGNSSQNIPSTGTVADIVVSPSNVVWYLTETDALSASNAILNSFPITTSSTYYAVANIGTCVSSPFQVSVNLLSNQDFNIANFSLYPNPSTGIININYDKEISNVVFTNVLGQVILDKNFNSNSIQIDLGNFPTSTYFAKITADRKSTIIKVIKN